jgi:hypothetical protein
MQVIPHILIETFLVCSLSIHLARAFWSSRASLLLLFPGDIGSSGSTGIMSVTLPPFLSTDSSSKSSSSSSSEQHPWVQQALASIALVIRINDLPAPPELLSSLSAAAIRALLSQVTTRHHSSFFIHVFFVFEIQY